MPALVHDIPAAPIAFYLVSPQTVPVGMAVGDTFQCAAELREADGVTVIEGRPLTWDTFDAAVLAITPTGLVTAAGAGTTSIQVRGEGLATIVGTIQVSSPGLPVVSATVSPTSASLAVGETVVVTARAWSGAGGTGNLLTGKTGSAVSADPAICTVSVDDNSADPDHKFTVTGAGVGGPVNVTATIT